MKKIIFLTLFFAGCVRAITLEPDIAGEITAFEVEGQLGTPSINPATRTVSVVVGRSTDVRSLRVTRMELVETATSSVAVGDELDVSAPLTVRVKTVANYDWTIVATRDTGGALPGGDFDQWYLSDKNGVADPAGKVWNPWPDGGVWESTRWWDTGNVGVTTLGASNSTPTDLGEGCPANPLGRAARLESRWAVLKAAGGNMFFGRFAGMDGLADAKCDMGHPWRAKPSKLVGWFKYQPQMIDRVSNASVRALLPEDVRGRTEAEWKQRMDEMSVTVALWASPDGADIPFTVTTRLSKFKDLTPDAEGIIAWGQFTMGETQQDWAKFSVDVVYKDPAAELPANTRLIITATSSRYANYFIAGTTGGGTDGKTGSLLYLDELELVQ